MRELSDVSKRADNPALLAGLPDLGIGTEAIVDDLDGGRVER